MAGKTYSTDEVMAMMQAPREDVQMLDKPASPFLDPAQINAAERELSQPAPEIIRPENVGGAILDVAGIEQPPAGSRGNLMLQNYAAEEAFPVDATPAPQRPDGGSSTLYPSKQETQPSLPKPVYSTDEVMALYTNESKPVYSTKDVMKQMIAPLYDPTAPRPSRDEYFKLKEMEKSLKESGDIEDPGAFEISTKAIGGLLVTAKDALSSFFLDSNDTLKRSPATAALAGQMVAQNYNALSDGLRAMGGPKFRVKETGEFITNDFSNPGGTGEASPTSAIDFYKSQGMTLLPIGDEDLKDWEYQQWNKKMDRNLAIEKTRTAEIPPALLIPDGMPIEAEIEYRKLFDNVRANEAQATVGSIAGDPMTWATGGAGSTSRIGLSAAAKGATAETLGIMGKLAQKVVQPTEQALTKAEAFKKLVVSPAKVASAYGAASGVAWAADKLDLPSELKTAAFTAASLYGAYKAGVGVLRFTANKLPEASVILRESANATNGFDVAARKAVAANADVPYSIRERLLRPSQFVAMESTPARLAKNMELSPGTRTMMDKLSNWYVVQGVRGASAMATGAVKGTAASVPFAELMRSAGDDESASAIYGMGAAFGSAGGAAERVFGARGRRFAQAESDVARFLTDVQGNATNIKDVKRYQWINTEIGRLLTDVELGAGDVSALVKNRSFDELARTAAMHGFFRDRVDFVPLNAADFELNAKGHGADGSAGYFLNMPDGQRPRIFVNVEARRADVEPHEFYEAFFSSDAFSPEQKASMRAAVDQRYGTDGLMARGREYAESLIKAENAKNFPNENLFVTSEQIAAKMDQLAQDELGRGGQDALDWVRREVMVEEARMAGIDYAAMRRNVPAGQNPITFIENLLGANARALGLSGVRVDPETGMAVAPEQLFKENPVAAGDPKLVKQLNGYLKAYKQWLNDPAQETPKGTRIAPDGRAESLANNPNVKFYDGANGKENSIAFVDASGRVIEKTPRQRAKERKLRGQQLRNMVGSKILEPGNTTFGLKRWADGRIRAGGKRLPDVMALQTHWKAHLPVIRSIEALSDAGESQQVLYFAKGNSADKVKSSRLSDIDAINREMVFDQWTTNAAGDLLAQFLDLTTLRNRAMKAISERNPALNPANGGPGYSLQAIMDDVNQWMADKAAGKAGDATIGPERKNVVNALINPGTNFNRGRNDLAGAFGRGSAIKTLLLEGINAVSGTGRKGAAMDYAWANGNFMPDKPAPRPNMDGDLAPPRMPQALPREAMGMPDAELQRQGFSVKGYHGGRAGYSELNLPAFVASSPDFAKWYAGERGDGTIYDVRINPSKMLDLTKEPRAATLQWLKAMQKDGIQLKLSGDTRNDGTGAWSFESDLIRRNSPYDGSNALDMVYAPQVQQWLRKNGYDGVHAFDTLENTEAPVYALVNKDAARLVQGEATGSSRGQAMPGTIKAYRGISKSRPFNDSGTTWLTTSKEAAESYATEVHSYEDPAILEVLVDPQDIPTYDIRKISEDQLNSLEPDEFGNPQKIGIYRNSDDSMLGGSGAGTVIHVPRDRVTVVQELPIDTTGRIRGQAMPDVADAPPRAIDMPQSAVRVLHADSDILPKPAKKLTNATVALTLADVAEKHYGGKITSSNITPEIERDFIINGADEAVAALKASGKNAGNWYSTAIKAALAVAGKIYRELSDVAAARKHAVFAKEADPVRAAQFALRLPLAITSQNMTVKLNTRASSEQFNIFLKTGKFDPSIAYGEKAKSISGNLDLANVMSQKLGGLLNLERFVTREFTVRELEAEASKVAGRKITIAGRKDDIVNGAAIFGPKIGQGFLQNLMGNFDPVTIDLWMRRTWGRWTGDVVGDGVTAQRLARLIDQSRKVGRKLPDSIKRLRTTMRSMGETSTGKPKKAELTMSEDVEARLDEDSAFRKDVEAFAKQANAEFQGLYRLMSDVMTPALAQKVQDAIERAAKIPDQADVILSDVYNAVIREQSRVKRQLDKKWDALSLNKKKEMVARQSPEWADLKPKERAPFIKKSKPILKGDWLEMQHQAEGRTAALDNPQKNAIKPAWANAAKSIVSELNPIDIPSDMDRRVISRVVNGIREELGRRGYTVTNADVQAILWYPEKDLWAKLRGEEESILKQSYDDEFISIAEGFGLGKEARDIAKEIRGY